MSESLYFIAIVPPSDIAEEITKLKEEVALRYNSKHALKSPPHITLHMPFKWKDKRFEELAKLVGLTNEELVPFMVDLRDFDFFEPRVVFVDVSPNEHLVTLQAKIVKWCRRDLKLDDGNYKGRPFHPHVTIGFRDLKKPMFYEAKKEFSERSFQHQFEVKCVNLLRWDKGSWHLIGS
ncbi:MAG: 2'-5' RNA ligase family protein [Ekhidna sp.]|nr:2'-5' RNA ligase family protein [Ekhidna sp.]